MEFKLSDNTTLSLPEDKAAAGRYLGQTIMARGRTPDNTRQISWDTFQSSFLTKDAIAMPDIRPILSHAVESVLNEPVEQPPVISGLFNRIAAKGLDHRMIMGAMGAIGEAADVSEQGTYPEFSIQMGSNHETVTIGKSGIQAAFTFEALRYTTWDIMGYIARQMHGALVRHREQKAIAHLRSFGTPLFDNMNPSTSLFGVATGRDRGMVANGVPIVDDLFKAWTHMSSEGWTPNIMLVHPLMFLMWNTDPLMRNMMLFQNAGSQYQMWQGQNGVLDPFSNGSMGAQGPAFSRQLMPAGNASGETPSPLSAYSPLINSRFVIPNYFPWPVTVMTSIHVPFDVETQTGDIYLLQAGNVGLFIEDEGETRVEFTDVLREQVIMRLRERYALAVLNQGQAIGVMKNMKVGRNYYDGTIQFTAEAPTSDIDPNAVIAL